MLKAIHRGNDFRKDNTEVVNNRATTDVYLHGNLIACLTKENIFICDGGWESNTTKSRLNALLNGFTDGMGVYQEDWTWYLTGPDGAVAWEGSHVLPLGRGYEHTWKQVWKVC